MKIVTAFVAGLVVALASVLFYVKLSHADHPAPAAVQTVAAPADAAQTPTTLPDADATPAQNPEPPPPAPVKPKKQHIHTSPLAKPEPSPDQQTPTEIAQANPPAPSPATVAPPAPEPAAAPVPATPAAPAPREPRTITIPPGTLLAIRLSQKLSTDQNYTGDTFRGTLENQVILSGAIIADRGSQVIGRIVNAQKAGRVEGVADLDLSLTEINTTDGQHVTIETNQVDRKGPKSVGGDAAKIAGGTALGAIIGAIAGGGKGAAIGAGAGGAAGTGTVLATRGKAAVFPVESRVEFRLASPVTITEHLSQ